MEFWSTNWGDAVTAGGIIISFVGFIWAIKVARGARSASKAAEEAASATKDQITHHLQAAELQRAIGLINRIKALHESGRWDAAGQHYQPLRAMLSDVIVRCTEDQGDVRDKLAIARTIVNTMENLLRRYDSSTIPEQDQFSLNQRLNDIQSNLEELASSVGFGGSQGGTR